MFEIGGSLREARLKRNLTPADVQKAIRIRDRYLQALEEERWELLPGDAYVKGFLRTYADYLGLDGDLYLERVQQPLRPPGRAAARPRAIRAQRLALRRRRLLRPLIVVAVDRRDRRRPRSLAAEQLLGRQAGNPADHVRRHHDGSHHTTPGSNATSTSLRRSPSSRGRRGVPR